MCGCFTPCARQAALGLWGYVINESDQKVPKALKAELPEVMWLAFLGVVLFWVHDTSENNERTRLLAARLVPIVVRMIGMSRLPVMKATVADVLSLRSELRPDNPET